MKTAFAKDIPFTAKSKRAISPVEYENKILAICQDMCWGYKGFVLPWNKTAQNTKVLIEANGREWTPLIHHIIQGKFKGVGQTIPPKKTFSMTEEEHLKVSQEFYDKHGFDVLGCAEPYKGVDTHLVLRCRCHGKIHTKGDLHNNRRQGGLTCPIVRGVLKSIQNGRKQVVRNKDAQHPMHFYLFHVGDKFFKFGITTRKDPIQRLREHQKNTNIPMTFEYSHLFNIGWQAGDLETGIKKTIRGRRISRKLLPQGYTETLHISKLDEVKKFIEEYISTNPAEPLYFNDEYEINIADFIPDDEIERGLDEWAKYSSEWEEGDLELDLEPLESL